jgi:hypothetical protein
MRASRLFVATILFMVAGSLNGFGYSVLCQSLPASVVANDVLKPLFSCAIPANAVASGKSIRVTANLHATTSGTLTSHITLNGSIADANSSTAQNEETSWSFIVTNTGGTGCQIGGTTTVGSDAGAFGPGQTGTVTVPWTSGWTLEIEVSTGTGTAEGDTFVVEILD